MQTKNSQALGNAKNLIVCIMSCRRQFVPWGICVIFKCRKLKSFIHSVPEEGYILICFFNFSGFSDFRMRCLRHIIWTVFEYHDSKTKLFVVYTLYFSYCVLSQRILVLKNQDTSILSIIAFSKEFPNRLLVNYHYLLTSWLRC